MKKCLALLVAMVATLSEANAVVVTRNAAGDVGIGAGQNAILNSAPTIGANTIGIDVTVLKAGAPFKIGFTMDDEGGPFPENRTYTVNVKMTNGITPGNMSLGYAMNGYDVDIIDPAGLPSVNMFGPFTSTGFAAVQSNVLGSGFRFGGFLGGGGEIYFNGFSNDSFQIFVSTGGAALPQNFTIDFVANPEPATLLLGSLITIPGGLALRRRRKAAAEAVAA